MKKLAASTSLFNPGFTRKTRRLMATDRGHRLAAGSWFVLSLTLVVGCAKQSPTMAPEAEAGAVASAPREMWPAKGAAEAAPAAKGEFAHAADAEGDVASPEPATPANEMVGSQDIVTRDFVAAAAPGDPSPVQPTQAPAKKSANKSKDDGGQGHGSGAGRLGAMAKESRAKPTSKRQEFTSGPAGDLVIAGNEPLSPPEAKQNDTSGESYAYLAENDFVHVSDDPLSTFSIDVDTASFANVRRFIRSGQLPPVDAVRIEEFINYFRYESREDGTKLSTTRPVDVESEVGPAPWAPDHRLVRLTMHSLTPPAQELPPRNLVFLIDVSGSMMDLDKLPLLKQAFSLLTERLRPEDYVSMVVYAGASGVVLPPTSGRDQGTILAALERLQAGGSTNGGQGIELAYAMAREHYRGNAVNRVILATDGDFNVGTTSQGDLVRMIERKREEGIDLSVLGFGTGNLKDQTMEQLADKGNGNYSYIDSLQEARKVLVQEAGSTLVTVAKDVKIQVEFNPKKVASYRLIGYENRRLAHRDFNDDRKDAGEVGAGHTVTALYEITPTQGEGITGAVDPLRYQERPTPRPEASFVELLHVKVRFKAPKGNTSEMLSFPVIDRNTGMDRASQDFRFAAAVASYGMILRKSKYRGAASLRDIEAWAAQGVGDDTNGYRRDFVTLVKETRKLSGER